MDFSNFDIEDFAFDETFQQWVLKAASPHHSFWENYVATHPHQTDKILAARTLVVDLKTTQQQQPDFELVQTIWQTVQHRLRPARRIGWYRMPVWQAAAALILIIGISAAGWWQSQKTGGLLPVAMTKSIARGLTGKGLQEKVNHADSTVRIELSDGSIVTLNKDSRLVYPQQFDPNQRVVYLTGEAFFEVKRNPKQPFLVYANETVTKVLGTSFRIKAYENAAQVTVAVRTGRVSVFVKKDFEHNPQNPQRTGLVLTPNQQAVFSREQAQLIKTLVEVPVIVSAPDQNRSFDFENTPLSEVFDVMEQAYGVDIVYDADLLKSRSLTVSMDDESLYEKLDVICKTVGISYQIIDAQVVIESKHPKNKFNLLFP
jgi:transmembrane sensor